MKHTYQVEGMTCQNCRDSVAEKLSIVPGVQDVQVDLDKGTAEVTMSTHVPTQTLREQLPSKYTLSELPHTPTTSAVPPNDSAVGESKLQQLKPLFLILFYISTASVLMHYQNWDTQAVMLDFMGLFYIVFSFFKMLDLKGFPVSFRMYDPLAKRVPIYASIYPFIETALGIMLLMRFEVKIALIITLIILGITTIGVVKSLVDKKSIRCACLGTVLNLPMTEATFIENAIMIVMAVIMLLGMA